MDTSLIYDWAFNLQLCLPLTLALICGAVIGAERARAGHPAGMRTYALVCFGSAMLLAIYSHPGMWTAVVGTRGIDPTRVVQGVLTGVGFLGAGVIVREGLDVRGLTSASAIWVTSAIGTLIGCGFYLAGAIATAITLIILSASPYFEQLVPRQRFVKASICVDPGLLTEGELHSALQSCGFTLLHTYYRTGEVEPGFEYTFLVRTSTSEAERGLVDMLRGRKGVLKLSLVPSGD